MVRSRDVGGSTTTWEANHVTTFGMSWCWCWNVLSRWKSYVTILIVLILSTIVYSILIEGVGLVLGINRLVLEVTDRGLLLREGNVGSPTDVAGIVV